MRQSYQVRLKWKSPASDLELDNYRVGPGDSEERKLGIPWKRGVPGSGPADSVIFIRMTVPIDIVPTSLH